MTLPPDASSENPFQLEPDSVGFESLGQDNGFRYWWASDLAVLLGYDGVSSFRKAVERASMTLSTLDVAVFDNIVQVEREINGRKSKDYKLSRFACYLVAMNGDPRKEQVAKAQGYFVAWAEACRLSLQEAENVERVTIRAEISDHERTLSSTVKAAGVENYAFFQNAGYRGLYNMNLAELRKRKNLPTNRSPLDFMGKTELAANLFRVTQTDEKIKVERIRGQKSLEGAAESVGKKIRKTMLEISGTRPESLPVADDVKKVQKELKNSHREIQKLDSPRRKSKDS